MYIETHIQGVAILFLLSIFICISLYVIIYCNPDILPVHFILSKLKHIFKEWQFYFLSVYFLLFFGYSNIIFTIRFIHLFRSYSKILITDPIHRFCTQRFNHSSYITSEKANTTMNHNR